MRFRNRSDAGRRLAEQLRHYELADPVVLALPRGGVPVAFEVAAALEALLDVFVARKVGVPSHPERDIGVVAEGGAKVMDSFALQVLGLSSAQFDTLVAPACAPGTSTRLGTLADEVVCVIAPSEFYAVGQWYEDFGHTSDEEVLDLLERAGAQSRSTT